MIIQINNGKGGISMNNEKNVSESEQIEKTISEEPNIALALAFYATD